MERLPRWWLTRRRLLTLGRLLLCVLIIGCCLMPKFPKPCVVCGVVSRESRCAQHRLPDRRPSTARRGSSTERRKIRVRALHRGGYRCAGCGALDKSGKSLEVDHILPLERGGDHSDGNLQLLCKPCHSVKTRLESEERRSR